MTTRAFTAVVIDDDPVQLDLMKRALIGMHAPDGVTRVLAFTAAEDALAELPPDGPVVILCDYMLARSCAVDWLPDFVRADVGPVIIVTASCDERIAADVFRMGAHDYIDKGSLYERPMRLHNAISEALRTFGLEQTNRQLTRR